MAFSLCGCLLVGRERLIYFRRLSFLAFWLSCCVLCLSLSAWQIHRLSWKTKLLQTIEQKKQIFLPVEALKDKASLAFYRIQVCGTFQHQAERHLYGRFHNSQVGVEVLTPFILSDGRLLLINRGWVALNHLATFKRPEGLLCLEGHLRPAPHPSFWTPSNNPATSMWHWIELPLLLPQGFQYLYGVAYREGEQDVRYPAFSTVLPNNHLSYALTWATLALGIFLLGLRASFYFKRRTGSTG